MTSDNPNPTEKLSPNEKLLPSKKLSQTKKLSQSEKLSHPKKLSSKKRHTAIEDHKHRDKKVEQLVTTAKEMNAKPIATARSTETKEEFIVPLRATIKAEDKDLDVTSTSIWTVMTLNNMTIEEVKQFEEEYSNRLTYSEKLSIKLLKDALRGQKEASRIYWQLQERIANRPKVLNQINFVSGDGGKEGSIMSQMLDRITQNINNITTQNDDVAQEGEIIEE